MGLFEQYDHGVSTQAHDYKMFDPFIAPKPLPILNPCNFVPKTGFQLQRGKGARLFVAMILQTLCSGLFGIEEGNCQKNVTFTAFITRSSAREGGKIDMHAAQKKTSVTRSSVNSNLSDRTSCRFLGRYTWVQHRGAHASMSLRLVNRHHL